MELKQIKELMAAMEKSGIKKLLIKESAGFELQLERHEEAAHPPAVSRDSLYPQVYHPSPHINREFIHETGHFPPVSGGKAAIEEAAREKGKEQVEGKFVISPMVGTFYSSPSPDDPPFVKEGDRVDENSVVCIIEAMKVMNEVKAGVSGVITEILVDNAHPVEFGTKMYRIIP